MNNSKLMLCLAVVLTSGCVGTTSLRGRASQRPSLMQTSGIAHNPVINADVPDPSIIRVGDTYYMTSTTMFYSPGVPIMKSTDLVNWEIVGYAYTTLGESNALSLNEGKNAYGKGSWTSSLRYQNGTFYCSTFSLTTNKTYISSTKNIEKGPWRTSVIDRALHDHSLFFEDDGRVYMVYGSGTLRIIE